MVLERIGPSVAFADAPRPPPPPEPAPGASPTSACARPRALALALELELGLKGDDERERMCDPAHSAPPTPGPEPGLGAGRCSPAPVVPLARSSSARSSYSLRSFGRPSDVLAAPMCAHLPSTPPTPLSRVASIGTPRSGRGNVDVSSPSLVRPPAARASHSTPAVPPPVSPGLPHVAPPSPPSLSLPAPPSPPLPPAAPAPSPACAPLRTTGRDALYSPSLGAPSAAPYRLPRSARMLSSPPAAAAADLAVPSTTAWLQRTWIVSSPH